MPRNDQEIGKSIQLTVPKVPSQSNRPQKPTVCIHAISLHGDGARGQQAKHRKGILSSCETNLMKWKKTMPQEGPYRKTRITLVMDIPTNMPRDPKTVHLIELLWQNMLLPSNSPERCPSIIAGKWKQFVQASMEKRCTVAHVWPLKSRHMENINLWDG